MIAGRLVEGPDRVAGGAAAGRLRQLSAALAREIRGGSPFLRWLLVNLAGFALLALAAVRGWVGTVVAGDGSGLVVVIAAVFAVALARSGLLAFELARELDQLGRPRPRPGTQVARFLGHLATLPPQARPGLEAALKLDLVRRIAPIRHMASSLVLLGLVGTVLGFVMALSGVDPEAAADVSRIGPMVSVLISGLGVALYTTLAGALLNIWAMVQFRLLEEAAARLVARLAEAAAGVPPGPED